MTEISFLKEWMVRYVKNKDLISKKIISVTEEETSFVVKRNDYEQKFFIEPYLKDLNKLSGKGYEHRKTFVCFHTKENFNALIKNWEFFVGLGKMFTICFVNPFSKTDKVLSLSPYTHNMISEKEALEQGLRTMSESVEFTTEEEIKKVLNS